MATSPNELLESAKCINCNIPPGMQLSVLIALLAKVAGINPDPTTLISMASCIECNIPPGMQIPVLIALADQIVNSQ
jgi:hypothetical protein